MGVTLFVWFREPSGLGPGDQAPSFSLPVREGPPQSLGNFRGKVVLLNFWATWCPPCRAEMPSLERLGRILGDENFEILAVSVDEQWSDIDRWKNRPKSFVTILLDEEGFVSTLYGVYRLPLTYLIDRDGTILKKYLGPREWDDSEVVQEILQQARGNQKRY